MKTWKKTAFIATASLIILCGSTIAKTTITEKNDFKDSIPRYEISKGSIERQILESNKNKFKYVLHCLDVLFDAIQAGEPLTDTSPVLMDFMWAGSQLGRMETVGFIYEYKRVNATRPKAIKQLNRLEAFLKETWGAKTYDIYLNAFVLSSKYDQSMKQ
jgi:hypothetical protein